MANNNRIAIRRKDGAISSIEERTKRKVADVDRILAEFVDVLRKDGYDYSRARFIEARSPKLMGWDQRSSSGVVALRSRKPASDCQPAKWTVTYVLVRREGKRGTVLPVEPKAVNEAIRRWPHEPTAAVKAAERWLWPIAKRQLARSEYRLELLIAPESGISLSAKFFESTEHLIGTRHKLTAQEIAECDGRIYALCPHLSAVNGDYPPFRGEYQWYSFRSPCQLGKPSSTSLDD